MTHALLKTEIPITEPEDNSLVLNWDREMEDKILDALAKACVARQDVILIDGELYPTATVYMALFGVPCVGDPTPEYVERVTSWRK